MALSREAHSQGVAAGLSRYESLLARFEKAWKEGRRPVIEKYLAEARGAPPAGLVELVHIELELRLRAGEPAGVEASLERFPPLGRQAARVLDLIAAEFRLRRRGEPGLTTA